MTPDPTCRCDLWDEPCARNMTQEDLRCDVCRDGCTETTTHYGYPPGTPEPPRTRRSHLPPPQLYFAPLGESLNGSGWKLINGVERIELSP